MINASGDFTRKWAHKFAYQVQHLGKCFHRPRRWASGVPPGSCSYPQLLFQGNGYLNSTRLLVLKTLISTKQFWYWYLISDETASRWLFQHCTAYFLPLMLHRCISFRAQPANQWPQETCTQRGHVFLTFWFSLFFYLIFVVHQQRPLAYSDSKDLQISFCFLGQIPKGWYIRHTHRCHGAMAPSPRPLKKKERKSYSFKWAISGEASSGGWVLYGKQTTDAFRRQSRWWGLPRSQQWVPMRTPLSDTGTFQALIQSYKRCSLAIGRATRPDDLVRLAQLMEYQSTTNHTQAHSVGTYKKLHEWA